MIFIINTFYIGGVVVKSTLQQSKFQNGIMLAIYTTQHLLFQKNCKSFRDFMGPIPKNEKLSNFNFNKKVHFL